MEISFFDLHDVAVVITAFEVMAVSIFLVFLKSGVSLSPRTTFFLLLLLAGSLACNLLMLNHYLFAMAMLSALVFLGAIHACQLSGAKNETIHNLDVPTCSRLEKEVIPQEKIDAIEQAVHSKKIYLDSNINLKIFSENIGIKPREVSNIVNSYYGVNFFEFINRLRIEEAKRLLKIEDSGDSILDIVYKSGFNSPSAFHRIFKRFEGITPSVYRSKDTNK